MADYAFRSLEDRLVIQGLWEDGQTAKDLANTLGTPLSTIYTELRRGRTGDRLPDQRLTYDAELAQLKMQQELERRGRRAAGA